MGKIRSLLLYVGALIASPVLLNPNASQAMSAHDFAFVSIEGAPLPLSAYAGKAVLLVNVASFCGFTPQYTELQELWTRYRARGLVVLGVPSNDFGGQEPGSSAEIKNFCETNFAVDFPLTEKQVVTGKGAHPLYRWIASEVGEAGAPKWNFHKYLLDSKGRLVGAWPSRVKPNAPELIKEIEAALAR
jgi:glutathione peroxidase